MVKMETINEHQDAHVRDVSNTTGDLAFFWYCAIHRNDRLQLFINADHELRLGIPWWRHMFEASLCWIPLM